MESLFTNEFIIICSITFIISIIMTCLVLNRDIKRYSAAIEDAKKKDEYIQY